MLLTAPEIGSPFLWPAPMQMKIVSKPPDGEHREAAAVGATARRAAEKCDGVCPRLQRPSAHTSGQRLARADRGRRVLRRRRVAVRRGRAVGRGIAGRRPRTGPWVDWNRSWIAVAAASAAVVVLLGAAPQRTAGVGVLLPADRVVPAGAAADDFAFAVVLLHLR